MGAVIARQIIEIITEIDRGFVARVDDMAEHNPGTPCHAEHRGAHIAALCEECSVACNFTGLERLAKGGEDRVGEICITHAIGASNPHASAGGKGNQLFLPLRPVVLIGLGIARCIGHCRRYPQTVATFKHWQSRLGRHCDNGQIDDFRD